MSSPSLVTTDTISEEWDYKRSAMTLVPTPLRHGYDSKECISIDTERLSEPEYPQPSRLYQCALVLAGFFATFQTIGLNQTYGIFQASFQAMLLSRLSPDTYIRMAFWTGFLYVNRKQHH
jgi:hypothetical protein